MSIKIKAAFRYGIPLLVFVASASAYAVDLNANFRLFGEVDRFGLGYGDMALHFGVNNSGNAPQIGSLGYYPGGTPFTTGVLSSVSLPGGGFGVVDTTFSVPFSLNIDQPGSMYIGFGDNGIGGPEGGSVQVIFDFSDNIYYGGSILQFTPDQGLTLTSVTLQDGTPLADVGLQFDFIPGNTVLTAAASAFDDQGVGLVTDTETPLSNACQRAFVLLAGAAASSKLRGGFDLCGAGIKTDALADLDVSPEPDPFVFDLAFATVSGAGNVVLTRTSNVVPEPPTILSFVTGLGFVALLRRMKFIGRAKA
jgi:hypothetical protein